jgi:hypothetical protein
MDFKKPFDSLYAYAASISGTLSDSLAGSPLAITLSSPVNWKRYWSTALSKDVSLDFIEQVCQDWGPVWQEKDLSGEREI